MASDLPFYWQPQRGSNPCLHLERGADRRYKVLSRAFTAPGLDLRSQHPSVAQSPLAKCWQAGSDGLCLSLQEVETGGRSRLKRPSPELATACDLDHSPWAMWSHRQSRDKAVADVTSDCPTRQVARANVRLTGQ